MAKLPGLHLREGVYQLRVMIPKDLRPAFGGRTKLIESLATTDNSTAKLIGAATRAAKLAEFAQKRRELNPQAIERVTPELAKLLAERVYAASLAADDTLRGDPGTAQLLLKAVRSAVPSMLTIGAATVPDFLREPVDPLEGLSRELAAGLAELNEAMDTEAAIAQATQRAASILPLAQAQARQLGFHLDPKAPGALDALRGCLKAYRKARQDVTRRDRGDIVDTPDTTVPAPAAPKQVYMRDVHDKWAAASEGGEDAKRACARALALYEEWAGPHAPVVGEITRAQGHEFKAWLLEKHRAGEYSSKTVHGYLVNMCGLLRFAHMELEWTDRHRWRGINIAYKTEKPRARWSARHFEYMAAHPLFKALELPQGWQSGGLAAYWIPLLGIYTGATVGELSQLQVHDVSLEGTDGAWLRIIDTGEGQKLKTEQRRRSVPIHSELVRLGFIEYWESVKASGAVSLWPKLRLHPKKPGNYFSGWWGEFRKADDKSELMPDFHSMRHTVRSVMADAGLDSTGLDAITGHRKKGSEGVRTYTAFGRPFLRSAIEAIRYPALLALPKVYAQGPTR